MRVVFPDPIRETLRILREELAGYVSTMDVSCGSLQVEDAVDQGVRLPYLMVDLDASETRYPVTESALLRVTVWADEVERPLEISNVVRAILHDHRGGKVRSFGAPSGGPIPASDPDSGAPLATQTITARLRPEPL